MKVIQKNQESRRRNSRNCVVIEYPLNDSKVDGVVGLIKGRYPDKGREVNEECKELAYIIRGKGKLVVEGKRVDLKKGSLVIVEPGERYYWEGDLEMFITCAPPWYKAQHRSV